MTSISIRQASIPTFVKGLENLRAIIYKANKYRIKEDKDTSYILDNRLYDSIDT